MLTFWRVNVANSVAICVFTRFDSFREKKQKQTNKYNKEERVRDKDRKTAMLYLLGITFGLICIIMCMTNGLRRRTQRGAKGSRGNLDKKKKDFSEQELHFITKILSIGLVDADPDTLHHLKEYRDLHGGST